MQTTITSPFIIGTGIDGQTPFLARVVRAGDKYGLDDCLTHDGAPMIEIYDRSQDIAVFGERGQFVTRYYASTLADHGDAELDMDTGIPVWTLSREATAIVVQLAKQVA